MGRTLFDYAIVKVRGRTPRTAVVKYPRHEYRRVLGDLLRLKKFSSDKVDWQFVSALSSRLRYHLRNYKVYSGMFQLNKLIDEIIHPIVKGERKRKGRRKQSKPTGPRLVWTAQPSKETENHALSVLDKLVTEK